MKKLLKGLLFLMIIGLGVGVYQYFASSKKEPERKEQADTTQVVEVLQVSASDKRVIVAAMGTVIPSRQVTLYPEVNGQVTHCHDDLIPGGRLSTGTTVVRIDPREYSLALKQQRANVAQARMALSLEKGRKAVAEREWHLIGEEVKPTADGKKLALREVQLETAEIALASAKSGLQRAKLNRTRTRIKAPFDALVQEKFVDEGQVVGPGQPLATLVDSSAFWVRVSVPVHQLPWIEIPNVNGERGSAATIRQQVSESLTVEHRGRVLKLLGGVEPQGKMARLLIEVRDPLAAATKKRHPVKTDVSDGTPSPRFPLLLDAYVSVEIEGPMLDNIIALPRHAVRQGGRVWVLNQKNTLDFKQVSVLWTHDQRAFVRGALKPGDPVVISRIDAPVEGMALRLEQGKTKEDSKPPDLSQMALKTVDSTQTEQVQ